MPVSIMFAYLHMKLKYSINHPVQPKSQSINPTLFSVTRGANVAWISGTFSYYHSILSAKAVSEQIVHSMMDAVMGAVTIFFGLSRNKSSLISKD